MNKVNHFKLLSEFRHNNIIKYLKKNIKLQIVSSQIADYKYRITFTSVIQFVKKTKKKNIYIRILNFV